ncbi:MAG: nickel pincer cofactor biosynthesis protein LarB [Nitrosopumilaceae archaeon]
MDLDEILASLKSGKITLPSARKLLSLYSIEKIENFAKIDTGRKNRRGIPEVVFAEKKQFNEIKKIIQKTLKKSNSILISRLTTNDFKKILSFSKKNKFKTHLGKNSTSILIYKKSLKKNRGVVGILTAGTSDIGIAEEARLMCEAMNCKCLSSYDVGVAGIHRVMPVLKDFIKNEVDSIIVVAGMEGALATLVSSCVNVPVIGVPTSVGYGYGEKGVAALASMLQSCALGLAVVNIDNGIGAGAMAASIANRASRKN